MMIQQVEKNIVGKVIHHYKEFDIAKVVISKYKFTEITGFNFQTLYYKDNTLITLDANANIADDVNILLKVLFDQKQKSNLGTIKVYPDGRYESEFIWDEQVEIDYLLLDMRTAFSFIYDESDIKITDELLPDQEWERAVITMSFDNGHILPLQIEVDTEGVKKHFSVPVQNLPPNEYPYLIETFNYIYTLANHGKLQNHFSPGWNTVLVYLDRSESFDFENHVRFEFRTRTNA